MGKSGRKFDLGGLMEVVSNLDTTAVDGVAAVPEVKLIPLADIVDNKANFYAVDRAGLKPLADSIAMDGLQQYPLVTPHPDRPGKYLLLSGHRRCAAIKMLVDEGAWGVIGRSPNDRPGGASTAQVPCTVREYRSAAMAELQLILANSTARVLSNAEISKQAERMEVLLYQLKEEGYEFPGRMRDQVAAACQVSAPKLARLKVIREKLKAPEFLLLFEKNRLAEQAAYTIARLPEEFQRRLAGVSTDFSAGAAEKVLAKYKEGWRWEPDMRCPDGKACRRGDAFLRHDLENPYDMCGGKTCCLACGRAKEPYSPCDRMCSRAQVARKEKREEKKAAEDARALKQSRQYQQETQGNARRVLRAIEAAGLADGEHIPWDYADRLYAGLVRKYAAGEFPEDERWYDARLKPDRLKDPAKTARVLGCSADYLLGLTEELTPPAAAPPPPGPEPEPGLPPVRQQTAASLLAQENLNRLHGLLLREEQAGSDVAGALCWAISTLARLLDVSKLDTLGEEGDEA
jgi:ParB family chromosome partitioning protein